MCVCVCASHTTAECRLQPTESFLEKANKHLLISLLSKINRKEKRHNSTRYINVDVCKLTCPSRERRKTDGWEAHCKGIDNNIVSRTRTKSTERRDMWSRWFFGPAKKKASEWTTISSPFNWVGFVLVPPFARLASCVGLSSFPFHILFPSANILCLRHKRCMWLTCVKHVEGRVCVRGNISGLNVSGC